MFIQWGLYSLKVALLFLLPLMPCAGQNVRPNIIFILTDDQGYGDLACHGNPWIKTPNLDLLHDQSIRFTNFHVGTTCAPSRAGLLSGLYPNKVGVWHTIKGRQILSADAKTIAQVLSENGYHTAIFGKWHLGDNYPFRPQDKGFDEVLIHKGGGVGQAPDYWDNDYFGDTYYHNGVAEKFEGYCTDVWFNNAIQFIERTNNTPFFCYIALNAPHSPYHVEPGYSKEYDANIQIPNPDFYGMIGNIDKNIGMLIKKLKDLNIDNNTILVFMTDNGTAAGVKFDKQGRVAAGFNAGMRGTKGSPYEGGHRVPFFIHWPNGNLPHNKNIDVITSYVDFMPTILDLCNINMQPSTHFAGKSLVPLLRDNNNWPERYLFVDTQREEFLIKDKDACVMDDQWRLLKVKGKTELYDIKADPGQINNIAAQYPDIVKKMELAYEEWWANTSANKDKYNRIIIGSPYETEVALSSHDCHSEGRNPAWDQKMVREGLYEYKGFWALEVIQKGDYTIELRRWPKESGLAIHAAAPAGSQIPGGESYKAGKVLDYHEASISIGKQKLTQPIDLNADGIRFSAFLSKGPINLYTSFRDKEGRQNNSYYVYITRN